MVRYLSRSDVWGAPTKVKNVSHVKNAVISRPGLGGTVTRHLDVVFRGNIAGGHPYDLPTTYWH